MFGKIKSIHVLLCLSKLISLPSESDKMAVLVKINQN